MKGRIVFLDGSKLIGNLIKEGDGVWVNVPDEDTDPIDQVEYWVPFTAIKWFEQTKPVEKSKEKPKKAS